jgi:acyl carrier protein
MSRNDILSRLNDIFREVFDDEGITVTDMTTADDIEAWDSLTHITLISEVEDAFGIKFKMKEIVGMKNVGEMADIIFKAL